MVRERKASTTKTLAATTTGRRKGQRATKPSANGISTNGKCNAAASNGAEITSHNSQDAKITKYFHPVPEDILPSEEVVSTQELNGLDLQTVKKEKESDVFSVKEESPDNVLTNGEHSEDTRPPGPTTPHKIQLLEESVHPTESPSCALSDLKITVPSPSTNAVVPPGKARRRLNNSQCQNKLPAASKSENHKVTDFFPVRRSVRKTKKTLLAEKQKSLEEAVKSGKEDGLEVVHCAGKGRGVIAKHDFQKGEYVVEYAGELIDIAQAKEREKKYAQDQNMGCYMYYFVYKNQNYCVDATAESGKLGRLVNHSRNGNLVTKTIAVEDTPRLVLIAKRDISEGEEFTYDYGDRNKESLKYHPWLAS